MFIIFIESCVFFKGSKSNLEEGKKEKSLKTQSDPNDAAASRRPSAAQENDFTR